MRNNYDTNKIYNSRSYGKFKIIKDNPSVNGHKMVSIKFVNTGTIINVRLSDALIGNVRDRYRKTMLGVACIGNASSYEKAYQIWESMIHRCYDKNCSSYERYGAREVTVCNRWLCFEYFLEDIQLIDGYSNQVNSPGIYHLDKDLKQQNIPTEYKIYSLNTCCFINRSDNSVLARKSDNKYLGVRKIGINSYNSYLSVFGKYYNLGNYPSEELAAAAYNNAALFYNKNRTILNDVPYVCPEKLIQRSTKIKEICKIIDK